MYDRLKSAVTAALSFFAGWSLTRWLLFAAFLVGAACGGCACHKWDSWFGKTTYGSFGWVNDPARVQAVLATMPQPLFAQAAPRLMQAAEDKDALLYLAAVKVTGKVLAAHDQDGTGCCVGEGNSGAVELLQCVLAAKGEPVEYKPISAAAVYALAREVGGMLGGGDGSTGADAIKAMTTLGTVSSEEAKDDDTTGAPHGALAKKWGRTGLPKALRELAKHHLVKTASQVRTADEARAALINGYPVVVCSDVGFEGGGGFRRDASGFCHRGGSWPHCMYCAGYRADRKAFLIIQSWGASQPPGPRTLDQPPNSFWISTADMGAIVRQGDSYALSAFSGFPAQQIDFFVRNEEPRRAEPRREWRPAARLVADAFALAP